VIAEFTLLLLNNFFDRSESYERDSKEHKCPPFHSVFESSSSEEEFSPCLEYFPTRYVIGTHRGSKKSFEKLASLHGSFKFVIYEKMKGQESWFCKTFCMIPDQCWGILYGWG